jgi:hypothetical protein
MLRIFCTLQCDVCGEFFEQLSAGTTANQNSCALLAAGVIETAESEGWFFNGKTRLAWCTDCVLELASNVELPDVGDLKVPSVKYSSQD